MPARRYPPGYHERILRKRAEVLRAHLETLATPDAVLERVHTDIMRAAAAEKNADRLERRAQRAEDAANEAANAAQVNLSEAFGL